MKDNAISKDKRVMIYNSLVKPNLMYNIVALPMKPVDKERLNSAHRAHLRRALGIFYPLSMEVKAEEIYSRTSQQPIAVDIVFQKWVFFGHVLRQDKDTPANRVMEMYFEENTPEGIH